VGAVNVLRIVPRATRSTNTAVGAVNVLRIVPRAMRSTNTAARVPHDFGERTRCALNRRPGAEWALDGHEPQRPQPRDHLGHISRVESGDRDERAASELRLPAKAPVFDAWMHTSGQSAS
jgi:hypothetical protein